MTRESLVVSFKNKDEKAIERIYNAYRDEFITWAGKTFNCEEDEAIEIYQQSMVIFFENVQKGKIDGIESKSKTYLFAIGKNKIYEKLRRDGKQGPIDNKQLNISVEYEEEEFTKEEAQLQSVEEALEKLGSPCRELLIKYYYHKNSMEDIAEHMDYKNAATVKNIKYKCLQRLKKLLNVEKVK